MINLREVLKRLAEYVFEFDLTNNFNQNSRVQLVRPIRFVTRRKFSSVADFQREQIQTEGSS